MQSLVSVIIPTYNRAHTIKRSIDSVLKQSYKNLELIVVDDGSSDDTVQIVKSYQDQRIRLICESTHSGANHARNTGIYEAEGEYIAFQDSDDEWLENKLEIQMEYMKREGKKVCGCPYNLFEKNEKGVLLRQAKSCIQFGEKIIDILRKKNVIGTPTLIIHKEVVKKVGVFDEEMSRMQDYEFVVRICQHYDIGYIENGLVNVYRVENSISNNRDALRDACQKMMFKHTKFLNLKYFLSMYLFNCEWYTMDGIQWNYMEDVLKMIRQLGVMEMENFCNEVRKQMMEWYDYFLSNIKNNEFIIYGAGRYAKDVYMTLKKTGVVPINFWVTHKPRKDFNIDGVPVLGLPDKVDEDQPVIVAVGEELQGALVRELVSRNVTNYYIYPFVGR